MHLPDGVERLLAEQRGLATVGQLKGLGLTASALQWRLAHDWHRVLPRVVQAGRTELDPVQRMVAGALYAGRGAVVTSSAAAAWRGVTAADGGRTVHVEVPAARDPASTGFVVIRRTVRPDGRPWPRWGIQVASPARAVISAAADARSPSACRAVVIEAVQRRICTLAALRHELESAPRRGSAGPRAALAEAESGAWSLPESDLLQAMNRSRAFPEVWANPLLTAPDGTRLPTPDAWIDEVALAVQVHSWRYHAGAADWERTVSSDGILAEHGIVVIGVTPAAIAQDPDAVVRRILRAYEAARLRPRPPVVARRRPG